MGDSKLYTRVKASDILTELRNYEKKPKSSVYRKTILKKIIVNLSLGDNEVVMLFNEVIKLLQDIGPTDPEAKQLCYLYLTTYWRHKPKETLNALSFITEDYHESSTDEDACLALRTLAAIQLPQFLEELVPMLEDALQKGSPSVRKTAAYCVASIFKAEDPDSTSSLMSLLNDLLLDPQLEVVSAALSALGDITEKSETLKFSIDSEHALKISQSLAVCGEWSEVAILNALMSFVPQDHQTAAHIIDIVLPYLQSENSSIVLNALKVIVYLCQYVSSVLDVLPILPQSISRAVANLMLKPPEIQFLAMRNVILLLLDKPALLDLDIRMFFCQYDDLLYIKDTKLEIIFLLADEDNIEIVLAELQEYALEIDVQMVRKSIRAIGNLAVKIDGTSEKCVSVLADLLSNSIPHVVEEIAIIARDILRKYPGRFDHIIQLLVDRIDLVTEQDSRASMIWILGEYGSSISNSVALLSHYAEHFLDEPSETQLSLLTAIVKAHVCQPYNKELHQLVEDTIRLVIENVDNPDVRGRGYFYWRILSAQLPNTIDIIKPRLPMLNTGADALPPEVRQELDLCIGTLASIYLRPVTQVFRHVKPKVFADSPARVDQDLKTARPRTSKSSLSRASPVPSVLSASQQLGSLSLDTATTRSRSSSLGLNGIVKKLSRK
ncbi:DEKNAAC103711 [Brettanomyces naardenensis]|uniref:AP complex subunit beta n=1 Tax=Brettanomyces naardenensis TaxID=13370 RepID=A0A448YNH6_BRENA|nr:DEKNAAC103711 [Brettanomyces naardenensis]